MIDYSVESKRSRCAAAENVDTKNEILSTAFFWLLITVKLVVFQHGVLNFNHLSRVGHNWKRGGGAILQVLRYLFQVCCR